MYNDENLFRIHSFFLKRSISLDKYFFHCVDYLMNIVFMNSCNWYKMCILVKFGVLQSNKFECYQTLLSL